jgi:hypothetical protein
MQQLDFFPTTSPPPSSASTSASPIVGLYVEMPRPCPSCSGSIGVIGSSGGPHANRVTCATCGTFRRWLGHREADFVARICRTFGCPKAPIILRTKEGV